MSNEGHKFPKLEGVTLSIKYQPYEKDNPLPRSTYATLMIDGKRFEGSSTCSKSGNFSYRKGRNLAIAAALDRAFPSMTLYANQNIKNRILRKSIWPDIFRSKSQGGLGFRKSDGSKLKLPLPFIVTVPDTLCRFVLAFSGAEAVELIRIKYPEYEDKKVFAERAKDVGIL